MSSRASLLIAPVVGAIYLGLLAPLVVVIAVSFGPSAAFAFPPAGFTLHWFAEFFASDAYVRSFFRVSLVVGVLAAAIATLLGTAAAVGLVRFRFAGREAIETFFLAPLLVPEILFAAALYLLYARLAVQASIWTLLCGHLVICTPYVIRSVTAGAGWARPAPRKSSDEPWRYPCAGILQGQLAAIAVEPGLGRDLRLYHFLFGHQPPAI